MRPRLEGVLAYMLLGGLGLIVLGIVSPFASRILGPAMLFVTLPAMALGLLIILIALAMGLVSARGGIKAGGGEPRRIPQCRVMGKYGIDTYGQMQFEDLDRIPGIKLFVRLWFPDGNQDEYGCAFEVYDRCAEGMWGSATVKGSWLGSFEPQAPPVQPTGNPYDSR